MKRRKSGGAYRKEKVILTASSVLVLTAMTVMGIYIYNSNQPAEPENNVVDFSALENSAQEKSGQIAQAQNSSAQNLTSGQDNSGELDYDPYYIEQERLLNEENASSGTLGAPAAAEGSAGMAEAEGNPDAAALQEIDVPEDGSAKNVGYAEIDAESFDRADKIVDADGEESGLDGDGLAEGADGAADGLAEAAGGELSGEGASGAQEGQTESGSDTADAGDQASVQEAVADVMQEEVSLHFSEDAKLQWPIVGNVLLNYSMDKTIYFPTLQQYKYNPSIVISATQGTSIACAANGVVKSIYKDPQTGTTVVMSLGDGYELSYGQLQDVMVEEGDFVEAGAFIAKVAAPTKYYTVEGTNVYFKLTKDGEPVNPMNYMG